MQVKKTKVFILFDLFKIDKTKRMNYPVWTMRKREKNSTIKEKYNKGKAFGKFRRK